MQHLLPRGWHKGKAELLGSDIFPGSNNICAHRAVREVIEPVNVMADMARQSPSSSGSSNSQQSRPTCTHLAPCSCTHTLALGYPSPPCINTCVCSQHSATYMQTYVHSHTPIAIETNIPYMFQLCIKAYVFLPQLCTFMHVQKCVCSCHVNPPTIHVCRHTHPTTVLIYMYKSAFSIAHIFIDTHVFSLVHNHNILTYVHHTYVYM